MKIKFILKNIISSYYCKKLKLPPTTKLYYIKHVNNLSCGQNCKIIGRSNINGLNLGDFSYISPGANISNLKVGKFCSIGPGLNMAIGAHPTKKFVSTYPSFFSINNSVTESFVSRQKFDEFKFIDEKYHFIIGNDVWIGSNVLLLEGHKIGDGAIIAAGSVVTKDIPPYEIWGGESY